MDQRLRTALVEHFSALEDPRQQTKVLYPLPEIRRSCSASYSRVGQVMDQMKSVRVFDRGSKGHLVSEVLSYIRRFDDDAVIADAEESPELAVS